MSQARLTTENNAAILLNKGAHLFIHESEGIPYKRWIKTWPKQISSKLLEKSEFYFSWGEKQIKILEDIHGKRTRAICTGSLRLEAISLNKDRILKNKINDNPRILIASSSCLPYPKFQDVGSELIMNVNALKFDLTDYLNYYNTHVKSQERLLHLGQFMKQELNLEDIRFRPHPFANSAEIVNSLNDFGISMEIDNGESMSHEALADIDILIHAGSTMCLEATSLGVASITSKGILGIEEDMLDHEGYTFIESNMSLMLNRVKSIMNQESHLSQLSFKNEYLHNKLSGDDDTCSGLMLEMVRYILKKTKKVSQYHRNKLASRLQLHTESHLIKVSTDYQRKYASTLFDNSSLSACLNVSHYSDGKQDKDLLSVLYAGNENVPIAGNW